MKFTPAELLLDVANPRFEPTANQREAINALLSEKDRDKMLALAGDIVAKGMLNPAESPIVVNERSGTIVLEGNRRLACLKVLSNPDLADDPKTRAAFERLAEKGTGPDSIEVWVAPSREAARPWIELRHTGLNGGVGVSPWTTEQQHRFDRRRGTQADRALTFTDGVASAFPGDQELLNRLRAAKARAVTTIGRVVADPDLRRAFGFDLRDGELFLYHSRAATRRALLRLLQDLADNPVGTFMGKHDRKEYYQKIANSDLPGKDSLLSSPVTAAELPHDTAQASGLTTTGDPQDNSNSKPSPKAKPTKAERTIYEKAKLKFVAPRVKSTLNEARRLGIDEAPHVSAVMLRVVLELVLTEAGERYGWFSEGDKLHQKVTKTVKKLDPNCDNAPKANKKLQAAYVAANVGKGGVGVLDLNQAVHSVDKIASPADVRAHSAAFGPLIVAVDDFFGQNP